MRRNSSGEPVVTHSTSYVHHKLYDALLDDVFVGRRGHHSESSSYAAIVKHGVQCMKLSHKEGDVLGRMTEDSQRVSVVMAARNGETVGIRGAHDRYWRWAYQQECDSGRVGWASRLGAKGCPCCVPRPADDDSVCHTCDGWVKRGQRGRAFLARPGCIDRRPCAVCGGGGGSVRRRRAPPTPSLMRAAHASIADGDPGRATHESGWHAGSRSRRRLGPIPTQHAGSPTHWMGFAGLHQTVVERLLREGGTRDEDAACSDVLDEHLADLRHILSGTCKGDDGYQRARLGLVESVRGIRATIQTNGGHGSALWWRVQTALQYLDSSGGNNDEQDAQDGWQALRSLIACDVPKPDWSPAGLSSSDQTALWKRMDKMLSAKWSELLLAAHDLRLAWRDASSAVRERRMMFEDSRGLLRTIMRAWRELTDDVRAGAAKFDQHWQHPDHYNTRLARRVEFRRADSVWLSPLAWQTRVILTWMRLVRAGVVMSARRRSARWREAESQFRRDRACRVWPGAHTARPGSSAGSLGATLDSQNGERIVTSSGSVTSGAATVLARRRRVAWDGGGGSPRSHDGGGAGGSLQGQVVCKRRRLFAPVGRSRSGDSGDEAHAPSRPRQSDTQLAFTLRAREALECLVGRWQWRPRFGDG